MMPAYGMFATYYDALNEDADYDRLAEAVARILSDHHLRGGIVADLGCGTGELTLRLAQRGYDMIAIDASADMLNALRTKMITQSQEDILLLCQHLEELDLYGTVRAAVSTFDTFNHLQPVALARCLERISLFMEEDGILIFDMNTPYKHEMILGDNIFEVKSDRFPRLTCLWENTLRAKEQATDIYLEFYEGTSMVSTEEFTEYYYQLDDIAKMLSESQFKINTILDGETFEHLTNESQRLLIVAQKLRTL